jgi:3'-phosphoadenosine 5'-phosphosulfate sulfotransferase (PAPS reductase)/FAD synthetase
LEIFLLCIIFVYKSAQKMVNYDKYIVAFSGGKDSMACFLHLLDIGIPKEKIELWHHDVDGRGETFMDWECTPAYCRAIAKEFGVKIYFSWKEGGFKREMLRNNSRTAPTSFEDENGAVVTVGGIKGKESTRLKFPQVSPDLKVRWCSAYLKIDVCAAAINNQDRFFERKTVVISGERAEESPARAKYQELEPDRTDNRDGVRSLRLVDRWRPIKGWSEKQIWAIIEKYKVRAHPAYFMGWGRVSCKFCIFGNANQFASAYRVSPAQGDKIMTMERGFGVSIKRNMFLEELIKLGTPYSAITDDLVALATSYEYTLPVIMDTWELPAGAFGESCGPV